MSTSNLSLILWQFIVSTSCLHSLPHYGANLYELLSGRPGRRITVYLGNSCSNGVYVTGKHYVFLWVLPRIYICIDPLQLETICHALGTS